MSTSLDVHCADCGAELDVSMSVSKRYSDSIMIDVSPCEKCKKQTEKEHEDEVTRLENIIDSMQHDVDASIIELQQIEEDYAERFSKLNAIVEALETCK